MKLALLFLALSMSLSARVGETVEQLKKRFQAAPVEKAQPGGVTMLVFSPEEGVTLSAFVVEGTVSKEIYTPVTREEAGAIRDKQGAAWSVSFQAADVITWKSPKGLSASFHNDLLAVSDGRFDAIQAAEKRKAEAGRAEQLRGF